MLKRIRIRLFIDTPKTRLIFSVPTYKKIKSLYKMIERRLAHLYKCKLDVLSLTTDDLYLFYQKDCIGDLVEDNSVIICKIRMIDERLEENHEIRLTECKISNFNNSVLVDEKNKIAKQEEIRSIVEKIQETQENKMIPLIQKSQSTSKSKKTDVPLDPEMEKYLKSKRERRNERERQRRAEKRRLKEEELRKSQNSEIKVIEKKEEPVKKIESGSKKVKSKVTKEVEEKSNKSTDNASEDTTEKKARKLKAVRSKNFLENEANLSNILKTPKTENVKKDDEEVKENPKPEKKVEASSKSKKGKTNTGKENKKEEDSDVYF